MELECEISKLEIWISYLELQNWGIMYGNWDLKIEIKAWGLRFEIWNLEIGIGIWELVLGNLDMINLISKL